MDAGPTASIPITRPHLPPMERFSEVVADLFASRLLSNFAKYTGLLESRAAAVLDHPTALRLELRHWPDAGMASPGVLSR